ncbi:MAG: 3-oxoacyl-[acyl-carrier-protein] synthase III C-terminal domain-containing protein [Candidatus Komeilibacteria bacterium]
MKPYFNQRGAKMLHRFSGVGIAGAGHTPIEGQGFRLVSNAEFIRSLTGPAHSELFGHMQGTEEQITTLSAKWENKRPGITKRCVTSLTGLEMAEIAAKMALEQAGLTGSQLDAIIFTSSTADRVFPKNSCALEEKLGTLTTCLGIDTSGSCADGVISLVQGASLVASGLCRHVLCVSSERATRIVERGNWEGGNLFGDGCGTVVLEARNDREFWIRTADDPYDGKLGLITQDLSKTGGPYVPPWGSGSQPEHRVGPFRQNGGEVHDWAGRDVVTAAVEFIEALPVSPADIRLVIPHQASTTTLDHMKKYLLKRLPQLEGKIFRHVSWRGNTSSASTLISLSEAIAAGLLKTGDWFVSLAFGAGLQMAFCATQV